MFGASVFSASKDLVCGPHLTAGRTDVQIPPYTSVHMAQLGVWLQHQFGDSPRKRKIALRVSEAQHCAWVGAVRDSQRQPLITNDSTSGFERKNNVRQQNVTPSHPFCPVSVPNAQMFGSQLLFSWGICHLFRMLHSSCFQMASSFVDRARIPLNSRACTKHCGDN